MESEGALQRFDEERRAGRMGRKWLLYVILVLCLAVPATAVLGAERFTLQAGTRWETEGCIADSGKPGPTALILSRQNLAQVERTPDQVKEIARGGYVLKDSGGKPDIILIATGSEMEITLQAAEKLAGEGRNVRGGWLRATDIFDAQDEEYRESVLPSNVAARVAVEAGIADYWYKYVGLKGAIVGMTGYGESAPADKLFPFFGFTAENIVAKAHKVLGVKGA